MTSGAVTSSSTVPVGAGLFAWVTRARSRRRSRPPDIVSSSIVYGAPASAAPGEDHRGRHGPSACRWRLRGHDRLAEHWQPSTTGCRQSAGGADEGRRRPASDVEHVDQVGGASPRGEALDGGARSSSPATRVDAAQVDPLDDRRRRDRRGSPSPACQASASSPSRRPRDVGPREPQAGRGAGTVAVDGGIGLGDDLAVPRGAGPGPRCEPARASSPRYRPRGPCSELDVDVIRRQRFGMELGGSLGPHRRRRTRCRHRSGIWLVVLASRRPPTGRGSQRGARRELGDSAVVGIPATSTTTTTSPP